MTFVSTAHFFKYLVVEFGKLHLSFILVLAVRQLSVAYRRRILKKRSHHLCPALKQKKNETSEKVSGNVATPWGSCAEAEP